MHWNTQDFIVYLLNYVFDWNLINNRYMNRTDLRPFPIPNIIHGHIYRRNRVKSLGTLSELTATHSVGLFVEQDEECQRYITYFRIKLLLEWGYYREALAWACLECELYSEDSEAQILKDDIKSRIRFLPEKQSKKRSKPVSDTIWGSIAGMREIKAVIERDLISPLKNPAEYRRYNIQIPQGFLFYGPPGCGKTIIAKQIATILKFHFIEVSPSTVGSMYVHGTQQKIKELFEEAHNKRPSILFIDEFEAFAPDRNRSDVSFHYQGEVNELLVQMNNALDKGIVVIVATNYKNRLDSSIIRPGRIDKKIFFGPPDFEARVEAFKMRLEYIPHSVRRWDYLGEETEYYTFAEIRNIVDEANRKAREDGKVIDLNYLMITVKENPPELNNEKLQKYF